MLGLKLLNFQKHSSTKITLEPITCIVGPTDAGKSAIMRALRWVCTNKPSGNPFLKQGADKVAVQLRLDDGTVVTRSKGKGGNLYKIGKQELRSFGADVPAPVLALTGLTEVNFQSQHDPFFWLTLSAGQAAKELNAIVDLAAIDSLMGRVHSDLRKWRADQTAAETRAKEAKAAARGLSWARKAAKSLKAVQGRAKQIEALRQRQGALSTLRKELEDCRQEVAILSGLEVVAKRRTEIDDFRKRKRDLESYARELQAGRQELKKLTTKRKAVKRQLDQLMKGQCPLCGNPSHTS